MNKGDKVICIKDYNDSGLLSKNDNGVKGMDSPFARYFIQLTFGYTTVEGKGNVNYPTNLFITVEQHREQQLNQILS